MRNEVRMTSSALALMLSFSFLAHSVDKPVPKEFKTRIDDYMSLRKRAAEGVPALKPKSEPEQIQAHKQALAQAIRSARAGAKQGDMLTPEVQTWLLDIVRSEMKGKEGAPAKKAVKQGNPTTEEGTAPVAVKVNAIYPDAAAASTVPSTLLLRLPTLPKELDFRFVGKHLVLRDVGAGLIIDFVPNVAP